jgi:hypothetical protein
MCSVEFDPGQRLLKSAYSEQVSAEEARRCAEELRSLGPALTPGFNALADLSGLETMDLDCEPYLAQMMDFLDQNGVNLVVRVIPDPRKDIGFNILSVFHYRRKVRVVTCETMDEALQILAAGNSVREGAPRLPIQGALE